MLEAEQLKIQGSKQKIGKTHVYKLIVDAIPYNFPSSPEKLYNICWNL